MYLAVPRTAQAEPPGLVVYVHGGGWLEPGNVKANLVSQTFANALLSAGYAVASSRVSSSIKAAIVFYPVINLLADRAWLSEISFCTGKYQNPDLPGSAASQYLGAPVQTVPGRAMAADPMTYLTPGRPVPKFLIAQGMHDCTVPYQGAIEFYKALVTFAGPSAAELILEPTAGHFSPPAEVNFNFAELEQPALKLLRETIGPG